MYLPHKQRGKGKTIEPYELEAKKGVEKDPWGGKGSKLGGTRRTRGENAVPFK